MRFTKPVTVTSPIMMPSVASSTVRYEVCLDRHAEISEQRFAFERRGPEHVLEVEIGEQQQHTHEHRGVGGGAQRTRADPTHQNDQEGDREEKDGRLHLVVGRDGGYRDRIGRQQPDAQQVDRQIGDTLLVAIATCGLTSAIFGRFARGRVDVLLRLGLALASFVVMLHPDDVVAAAVAVIVLAATLFGVRRHRHIAPPGRAAATAVVPDPVASSRS